MTSPESGIRWLKALAESSVTGKKKAIVDGQTMSKRDQPLTMQRVRAVFLVLT